MSTQSARRIIKDIKQIEKEKSDFYTIQVDEEDIYHWKGFLEPTKESLYYGLLVKFDIYFPREYPLKPFTIQFEPDVLYHPNIYKSGKVCLDVLQNKWTPLYSVHSILLTLLLLLREPNPNSPANAEAAKLFEENQKEFFEQIKQRTELSWKSKE